MKPVHHKGEISTHKEFLTAHNQVTYSITVPNIECEQCDNQ
jgi:hypothetical protein